jgi:methylated-DNA-protein-cysteine methyltransferase related protein
MGANFCFGTATVPAFERWGLVTRQENWTCESCSVGRSPDRVLVMRATVVPQNLKRRILKEALREDGQRDAAFRRIIRSVPKGKVSTYGKVASAAGYPLYHRAVARLLRQDGLGTLPWQRIVGAGGEIKLRGEAAAEQRFRLNMEGVKFRGKRVNMEMYEHTLRSWETFD